MVDPPTLTWLEARLRQEEQATVLRHRQLLHDLQKWKLGSSQPPADDRQQTAIVCPPVTADTTLAQEPPSHDGRQQATSCVSASADEAGRDRRQYSEEAADVRGSNRSSTQSDSTARMPSDVDQAQTTLSKRANRITTEKVKMILAEKVPHLNRDGEDSEIDKNGLATIVYDWRFEAFFALLILLNALSIGSEVQYKSYGLGWLLGWNGAPDEPAGPFDVQHGALVFQVIDIIFGMLFWLELVLKMVVMKSSFFADLESLVDLVIMVLWTLDLIIVHALAISPTALRLLRLVRLVRLVRFVNSYEIFDTLILMMCSVKASLWVLLWSICLLVSIMLLVALIMYSTLEGHMLDETAKIETKLITYKYFGSFSRSMVSMFEITLGNWVPICRHLMDNVTERYALLIVVYRLLVCEGVLKVISSIFLQQTMQCANNDDQLMIDNKSRQRERFVTKMKRLLTLMDTSGDGLLSREEFATIMELPRVKMWLSAMELNVRDADTFFTMLDKTGDGQLDVHELVAGMSVLKGHATQLHMESTESVILKHLQSIEGSMFWLQSVWPRILEHTSPIEGGPEIESI